MTPATRERGGREMRGRRFLPHGPDFFALLTAAAANAVAVAGLLTTLLAEPDVPPGAGPALRAREHEGDAITQALFTGLIQTAFPPLSQGDLRALAGELDAVVDQIEEAGQRYCLYRLAPATDPARQLARLTADQTHALTDAIALSGQQGQHAERQRGVAEVHRLETAADAIFNQALGALYAEVETLPELIRAVQWQELYQLLETATDRAEHVANTLDGIMMQRAWAATSSGRTQRSPRVPIGRVVRDARGHGWCRPPVRQRTTLLRKTSSLLSQMWSFATQRAVEGAVPAALATPGTVPVVVLG
jgi:uncharacterized protein